MMTSSLSGCAIQNNSTKDESSKILGTTEKVELYISPEGFVWESEEDYLRVLNFNETKEELAKKAYEENIELSTIEYFSSYNFDCVTKDTPYICGYSTEKDENGDCKPIYSYSINSSDPNIIQVYSDRKRVCVPDCIGIWDIYGVEVTSEDGEIYLVYPDYELVEFNGKKYVTAVNDTAYENLRNIESSIATNTKKYFK